MKEESRMSDKQMKTLGLGGNLHVSYDVCIIRATNHGQFVWS